MIKEKPGGRPENWVDQLSRRRFLQVAGTVVIGVVINGCGHLPPAPSRILQPEDIGPDIPFSTGYLLVDTRKCQGCASCMLACSLVHEGKTNLSLSRIQVLQDPFGKYPDDISLGQCRQCLSPECVDSCPSGALYIDKQMGKVRRIDIESCIGCGACIDACPYQPARIGWNHEKGCAQKCDLCTETPYWQEQGGIGGKQACVSICPVKAISFSVQIPVQEGDEGYHVNLRDKNWAKLGFPRD